jgi:glycosyltransferase involved in cell wall biosynthesis
MTKTNSDQNSTSPGGHQESLVIGICTANRTDLLMRLLDRLPCLRLDRERHRLIACIVVDNSRAGSARAAVQRFAASSGMEFRYHHLADRGLARARNTMLDLAAGLADTLAMIDDDEVPDPGWLEALVDCRAATGAEIVTGPVYPRFMAAVPRWLEDGRFLELETYPDGAKLTEAISGNALLYLPAVVASGLRFDRRYDRTGGEDQVFFRQAARRGLTIRYASRAAVHENVPPGRTTFGYLVRREFRKGNTLGLLAHDHPGLGETPVYRLLAALKWLAMGALAVVTGAATVQETQLRRGFLRWARSAGMIGGLAGWRYAAY